MGRPVAIVRPPKLLMLGALAAISGGLLTMLAWRSEKAKKLYLSQCDVALANPRFSSPDLAKLDVRAKTFDGKAEEFERYEWYVARLVYTLDECLSLCPTPQWYAVAKTQLGNHRKYFSSDYYRQQDYLSHHSVRMRMLIGLQTEA